jgi:hypothetical protein
MTLTFENDNDVIVYALEKIIAFARKNQFLFVANCAWWLAGVTGLDSGLITYIDNLESRKRAYHPREISNTPGDIARSESVDPEQINFEETVTRKKKRRNRKAKRVTRSNPKGGIRKPKSK